MFIGIKWNFKTQYKNNIICPLECQDKHNDTQENLINCPILKRMIDTRGIIYNDLFSEGEMQLRATKTYIQLLKTRNSLLNNMEERYILNSS